MHNINLVDIKIAVRFGKTEQIFLLYLPRNKKKLLLGKGKHVIYYSSV